MKSFIPSRFFRGRRGSRSSRWGIGGVDELYRVGDLGHLAQGAFQFNSSGPPSPSAADLLPAWEVRQRDPAEGLARSNAVHAGRRSGALDETEASLPR